MDLMGVGGTVPEYGAIFMSNRKTMEECLRRKLFGLPYSSAGFVKHVKVGMVLFLFEYERRELHGVFQASTDGAIDIVPEAFCSSGKQFSAQVRVTTIWNCTPLYEEEFNDAIQDNYFSANKFHFGLSEDQVHRLLLLFSSKKLKQPQRHLRRSRVLEIVRKDEVINTPSSCRFPISDRVGNDHNIDKNVRLVSAAEYRDKSLGKEMTFYDHCSTEIPVNHLGNGRRVVDDNRFMMSNRERNQHHVDDDPGMAFPTNYYGNSLGDVRGGANVDMFQTDNETEPFISTDYLCKPNLSTLEHSGGQPYFESSALSLREKRPSSGVINMDPCRSGTPSIHYSGLYHSSDSVREGSHSSSPGKVSCTPKNQSSPCHLESGGVTKFLDITSGFRNCVSSPTPDDYECFHPRITMPFSGPGYSESNAIEYSDPEDYSSLSFAGSSLLPVSLLNGENVGPAPYSLRPINETGHDYGYAEASHDKDKQLARSGNSEAYAANVSLLNEVQCHSRGDPFSLETESITLHENNMLDHDFESLKRFGGMYSAHQKSRSSVFSRLTFLAEASAEENDSPVDYNERNVDTSVDEFMAILHDSSYHWAKKLRKSKSLTGHDANGEKFRRQKPKNVYNEMERDQGTPLLIQKNAVATLGNGESDCERAKAEPAVHFKRRSKTGKLKDEIKMGGFVEGPGSSDLSETPQKRRKLVRPNFSKNDSSHEKDAIGESTPNPQLSSQESSFSEDNDRKSGALDRNHGNEKEGHEQAGLLDACQVGFGKSEALDGNHGNEKEKGPEQAGLQDACQVGCEKSGALDRNSGNENKEGPKQAGLLDACQVGSRKSGALEGDSGNGNKEVPEQAGLLDACQGGCEGISEAQSSSDVGYEGGIKCSVTGTESTQKDGGDGGVKEYEKSQIQMVEIERIDLSGRK